MIGLSRTGERTCSILPTALKAAVLAILPLNCWVHISRHSTSFAGKVNQRSSWSASSTSTRDVICRKRTVIFHEVGRQGLVVGGTHRDPPGGLVQIPLAGLGGASRALSRAQKMIRHDEGLSSVTVEHPGCEKARKKPGKRPEEQRSKRNEGFLHSPRSIILIIF